MGSWLLLGLDRMWRFDGANVDACGYLAGPMCHFRKDWVAWKRSLFRKVHLREILESCKILENPNLLIPATIAFGVFPLFLLLVITAFGGPEVYFSLAIIAFGAFQFVVPKYYSRLRKMEFEEPSPLI